MSREPTVDRRSVLKAAGGAAATMAVAGCLGGDSDDGENSGGPLVYGRGADSATLDPQATSSGEDAKVINQVYDRLVHFEAGESTLVSGLAEDYGLEETTTTLTLREGVTFSNGDELTAEDFIATYRRFVDEEYDYFIGTGDEEDDEDGATQSFYGPYLFGPVESVEATGDYELEIELEKRYAPFLRSLAVFAMAVLPKSEIENDHDFGTDPIGTGPFTFDTWETGNQRIRLSPNEEYWGETPKVDELVFEAIGENSSRAQALGNGEVDIIDGVGAAQSEVIEGYDNAALERTPGMTIGYMAFNMDRVEEFRDRRVRQAISHAIDTQAIVENIYRGLAIQASQPLPPTVMGHDEDLDPYEYDPDRAQELLAEADLGDGFSFELATMTNPRPYFASPVQTAETVRSNLDEVGIDVEINEQSTWDAYLDYTAEGKHDACFLGWISDNADPDNFYSPLLHPGVAVEDVPDGQDWVSFDAEEYNDGSRSAWANTEFMELVEEAQQTYDEGEREEMYLETAEIVHEEAPWVFMTHTEELRGVHERVDGYVIEAIGGPFLNLVELGE